MITILFSPGTSYDQYKNFEIRGNHFKKLINAILVDIIQIILLCGGEV